MAKVIVSPFALADQDEILTYLVGEAGFPVAQKYDLAFRALLERLSHFPGIGAPRPELGDGVRIYVINPYIAIYEGGPDSDVIVIHRVVHGRRDIQPSMIQRPRP